ncbi:MAG: hypothetical protein QW470_05275 [Candidatus Caldarchaeum sp.]
MRAQLAVSSLIVFGLLLIGMGIVKLPYVSSFRDTIIMQTSTERPTEIMELATTVLTVSYTTVAELDAKITTSTVETVTNSRTVTQTLISLENKTLEPDKPLLTGPFKFNSPSTVEVMWSSNSDVELYRASGDGLGSWVLVGRGFAGVARFAVNGNTTVYVILKPVSNNGLLTAMRLSSTGVETFVEERTRTTIAETKTAVTTLAYTLSSKVYTTLLKSTKTDFFTVAVETTVTETRYADLWFMTAMGSFLVFVGLLLTILLLRTLAKPVDKTSE